jgi:hypothetical protein
VAGMRPLGVEGRWWVWSVLKVRAAWVFEAKKWLVGGSGHGRIGAYARMKFIAINERSEAGDLLLGGGVGLGGELKLGCGSIGIEAGC